MCGIAGIVNFNAREDKYDQLLEMIGRLHHRGPDAVGIFHEGPVGLGHARLSIIDLSSGNQPIHNEDRSVWIVYNGEIFNYPELRNELEADGHRFYTKTDTEVLVHLYEDFGYKMLSKLNGQFAFAIWDAKAEKLFLARDRFGIRPLHYYHKGNRFLFASEIKALFADSKVPRRLNLQTLSDIFVCWSPFAGETVFENIEQIPPAHFAVVEAGKVTVQPYWDLKPNENTSSEWPLDECTQAFAALLLDAARIRLRADVPVGAYLSGGIDSTYISSLIKHHFNNRLATFSIAFSDAAFDETRYQEDALRMLQTEHQRTLCSEADIRQAFPSVVWHAEMPMLRTAPAPLYLLSKLVRQHQYKVVLTGEGADEILAGYNIFKEAQVRRFWARQPTSTIRPLLLERLYPYIFSGKNQKAKAYLKGFFKHTLQEVDSPVYSHLTRWKNTSNLRSFFSPDVRDLTLGRHHFIDKFTSSLPQDFMRWPPLTRAQYIELKLFLPNYLLSTQGDRMAMANSIEGRYPFLDHRVVELAFSLPTRYRLNGLTEKFILKHAARGAVPEALIKRSKHPYRAPISTAFREKGSGDYVDHLLSPDVIREKGYFDAKQVANLLAKRRNNDGRLNSERENMAFIGILSTQLIDQQYISDFPLQSSGAGEGKIMPVIKSTRSSSAPPELN